MSKPMEVNFSVIIPTRARPGPLAECLASLARQRYSGGQLEVIVVDDGGGTPLEPIVAPYQEALGIRLLVQAGTGPARARNRGAELAVGNTLVFLDDDCRLEAGWLTAAAQRLQQSPQAAVGGRLVNAFPANVWAQASQMIVDYIYETLNANGEDAEFLGSGHLAVPAAEFQALAGFSASFPQAAAEDRDFCARWRGSGRRLIFAPEMVACHAHNLSFKGFFRQHFAYGRGARRFYRKQPRPGPEFYWGLLHFPWRRYPVARALRLWLALLLSQFAHTAGYLWERPTS